MDAVTAAISSPLKVRQRKHRIWAEDATGQVVVDGRTREHWPERYVAATVSGTHRVAAEVNAEPDKYLPIIDVHGREVARIIKARRQDWVLRLGTGEVAPVSHRSGLFKATSCTVADLSRAVAPQLAPQRYFTLTLADAVLNHPDCDALVVALTWISELTIAARISRSTSFGGS